MKLFLLLPFLLIGLPLQAQDLIYYSSEQGSSGRDIYTLNVKNGTTRKLTQKVGNGHYPHYNNAKLSPDGSKLVYQADTDGHDRYAIWTMNTDGTQNKRITKEEGMYPNWSPDSKTIIFSGRRQGVWEIILIPSQGGVEQIITKNREKGKRPGWGATCSFHPNGKSFLYSYIREKDLYSFDIEEGTIKQLTEKGNYTHPIYSNDGSSIVVNRRLDEGYDLVVMKDDKEEIIATSIISYSAPDWVANDSRLLFVGSVNGNQEIFIVDLDTKEEKQLTKNSDFDGMPVAY